MRRLEEGPRPLEQPLALGTVRIAANCTVPATIVGGRTVTVLRTVVRLARAENWPDDADWQAALPKWFVGSCAPEETTAEAEAWLAQWRKLPPTDRAAAEEARPWTLSAR
jgi:hypothetical protein